VGGSVEYSLHPPGGPTEHFRKVGGKVPDKVTQVLNLGELNLQGQLDQPYLVTAGTGEISRAVNQVVDLEVADGWLSELASRRQRNTQGINGLKQQHQGLLNGLKAYNTLPSAEKALTAADRVQTALKNKVAQADGLASAITTLAQAVDEVVALEPAMAAEAKIRQADNMLGRIKAKKAEQQMCANLMAAAQEWEQAIVEFEKAGTRYMAVLQAMGVCPTCYGQVTQDILDNIAGQLTAETL
jgi:hypothetical protein